jgi:fumarate reductase flavoprotein subunit
MPETPTRVGILVVGAGLAGLAAAARAAELGSEVTLLDRSSFMGDGNTLTTTGLYSVGGLSPNSPPSELYNRVMAGGAAFPEPARAYADNCRRALQWLESVGIQVDRTGDGPPYLESSSGVSQAPVFKTDVGPNIVKKLRTFFHAHRGTSTSNTRVVKLLKKKGNVIGVEAVDSAGKRLAIRAGATILATGGFQANRDLLKKYVGRQTEKLKLMGSSSNTGDGLKMALGAGAKAVNLKYVYGRMVSSKALTDDRLWPYPTFATLIDDGIVVDRTGRRFRDEGWGDIPIVNALARGDDGRGAYLIFDEVAWERAKGDTDSLVRPNPWLLEKAGDIYKAESLSELATKLGVFAKTLDATVEEFNAAATRRRLGELRVPRINHPNPLKPPLYGVKIMAGIISTMGGPLIDRKMRVVDKKGNAIPGLYAAGDLVGGLMGGLNGGYIGGLSQAAVTGVVAGESANKFVSLSPFR